MTKHLKHAHEIGNVPKCDKCNKIFSSNNKLKFHNQSIHKIDVVIHKCNECGLEFDSLKNCKRHEKHQHGNPKRHHCDIVSSSGDKCELSFLRSDSLLSHKQKVHDIGDNPCDYCKEPHYSNIVHEKHKICKTLHFSPSECLLSSRFYPLIFIRASCVFLSPAFSAFHP